MSSVLWRQLSGGVRELGKQKEILEVGEFLPGFAKEEELACEPTH